MDTSNETNRINHSKGTRNERKLRKYSENFNKMFLFFLMSHRKGLLTFSGSEDFKVKLDLNAVDSKECFRKFDNGQYSVKHKNGKKSIKDIPTRHPNILYSVIKGKKSWGLWAKEWSLGIAECNFTKEEILTQFSDGGIEIPESLIKEFEDNITNSKIERYKRDYKTIFN